MQRRVFLHVGLHKTGTTYLQNLLRENRHELRRHGIGLPPGRQRRLILSALDLTGRDVRGTPDARIAGSWHRLATEVARSETPVVVVSEERLSLATAKQARRAVESFADLDVHVIVTVRDLARGLVSQWQEEIKNGNTWTLAEYVAAVRDPLAVAATPARGFWLRQDVAAVVKAWSTAVPADRVHVVTVPPVGAPADLLTHRFGEVVGFDANAVPAEPPWSNENTGVVGTELLRRLNERLRTTGELDSHVYNRGVKGPLVPLLAHLPDKGTTELSDDDAAWARERATDMVRRVEEMGHHVVGALTDLIPGDEPMRASQQSVPTDSRLLGAALDALAVLSTRQGQLLVQSTGRAPPTDGGSRAARAAGIARSVRFRAKRAAADLAGRTAVGRRAAAAYLRRRSGR